MLRARLSLAAVLSLLFSSAVRAGVVALPTAGVGGGGAPVFAPATQPWTDSFTALGRWLSTPEGFAARSVYPSLGQLPGMSPSALAIAVRPMTERLPEAARAALAAVADAPPEERASLLAAVEEARLAAAPEVEARAAQAVASLRSKEEPPLESLRATAVQLKGFSFYGPGARHSYKTARRMAVLRAMRMAGDGSRRLLEGLDWDSDLLPPGTGAVEATVQGRAAAPRRTPGLQPAIAALPPSSYYDARHWSSDIVPDRAYARRLAVAAELLSDGDKASSPKQVIEHQARERLVQTLRDKDPKIASHMMRVGLLAGLIAYRMGFDEAYVQKVAWGARIHDIGKREDEILTVVNKEGKLTPEERAIMQRHPEEGAAIILSDPDLPPVSRRGGTRVALNHHETMDGAGYPRGISGEDIPMESRITSIADYFDALMEHRPYRKGMSVTEALAIMSKVEDKFDPAAWRAFLSLVSVPAPAPVAKLQE